MNFIRLAASIDVPNIVVVIVVAFIIFVLAGSLILV